MADIQLSNDMLLGFLQSIHYNHEDRKGIWNILGVRGALRAEAPLALTTVQEQPDRYNDTLVVFGKKQNGDNLLRTYRVTVDPGRYWTVNPCPKRGCAHLMNGQYRYQIGLHQQKYLALRQADKVKIWRDANRNYQRDGCDFIETGFFGINIHAGGTSPTVGMNSAGCQVLWGGRYAQPYVSFMELMQASTEREFWYSLVDGDNLAAFAGNRSVDPVASPLAPDKKQALQQVLSGIAVLYNYENAAQLGDEEGVRFVQLLNRLRKSGVLANVTLGQRPAIQPVESAAAARACLIEGFRRIYGNMVAAGLDGPFHSQLNQLRHFGPLGAM